MKKSTTITDVMKSQRFKQATIMIVYVFSGKSLQPFSWLGTVIVSPEST